MDTARALPPRARDSFLKAVAGELRGQRCPDEGDFDRALRRAFAVYQSSRATWLAPNG